MKALELALTYFSFEYSISSTNTSRGFYSYKRFGENLKPINWVYISSRCAYPVGPKSDLNMNIKLIEWENVSSSLGRGPARFGPRKNKKS